MDWTEVSARRAEVLYRDEGHTLLNLLHGNLVRQRDVVIGAYKMQNQDTEALLTIVVKKAATASPRDVYRRATEKSLAEVREFELELEHALSQEEDALVL